MKKRILAFVLVMLTVFGAFPPVYSMPSSASVETEEKKQESVELSRADMVVGKQYTAYFKGTEDGSEKTVLLYSDATGSVAYGVPVSSNVLPHSLKVVLENENDNCVKILNENWNETYEAYRYAIYSDLAIYDRLVNDEGYVLGMVTLSAEEMYQNTLTINDDEKILVAASTDDDIESGATYEWQVKLSSGRWAVVSGFYYYCAILSRPLLVNVVDNSGAATVRCLVKSGNEKYVSDEIKVTLADYGKETLMSAKAPVYLADGSGDDVTLDEGTMDTVTPDNSSGITDEAFQIVIAYTFRHANPSAAFKDTGLDGKAAANTFTVTLPAGGSYSGTIATPAEEGYLPYVLEEYAAYVTPGTSSSEVIEYDGKKYVAANSIIFNYQKKDVHIDVYFIPQEVNYVIEIYEQKLYTDDYTLVATEIKSGTANAAVGAGLRKTREGFSPLAYNEDKPINEDGTTVVELYYERNYFSVDFEFGEYDGKVNGVTPSLVRYNTPIMLPTPSMKGYEFKGWKLLSVLDYLDQPVSSHSYGTLVDPGVPIYVRHKLTYESTWALAQTTYTVVYWLEDAESKDSTDKANYNVWYTHKMTTMTGNSTIAGTDNVKTYITVGNGFTQDEMNDVTSTYPYLTYNSVHSDTEKTTRGDGTTAINVYYSRKSYNLKFYYAIEKSNKYYVIGGSTYYFGSYASGTARTDEIAAMRQYATGSYTSQTGQVNALPTLKEGIKEARGYNVSFDTDNNNKYHYISFNAKFGADITNLWPCDVFESANRTSANTHGNWSGTKAFVSAWNGEYRVRYTQDGTVNNGNQTIKGKYTVLDANLLWNDTSVTDTTVSYACFWENGANINWSVPELYRYNIYLPLLPGQSETGLTIKEYNGTRYYLADQYNTCDDSTTSAQTQPGLVGFRSNGRTWATITGGYDTSLYKEAYDMFYFYSRNIYHLTFNDTHGNIVTLTVPYDTYIGNHNEEDHAPAYPSDFEPGEAEFVDWYYDESYTIEFSHDAKMPAKNIQLYAKWKTLSYDVKVYYDTEKQIKAYNTNVPFGTYVDEPDYRAWQKVTSAYEKLIFNGWYYKNGEEEIRFDFNTMMVKGNMEIYAKWTHQVSVDYAVHYVIINPDGTMTQIASSDTGQALVGVTKYFVAKVADQLDTAYQKGYYPEMRSHSLTMQSEGVTEYFFVYTYSESITYTVTHKLKNSLFVDYIGKDTLDITLEYTLSGEQVKSSAAAVDVSFRNGINMNTIVNAVMSQLVSGKTFTNSDKNIIWEAVKNMSPDAYVKEILLTTAQENEAIFNWTDSGENATYQIIYYFEDLTGEFVPDPDKIETGTLKKGTTKDAPKLTGADVDGFTTSDEVVSGTVVGFTVNADGSFAPGLILRVYYTRVRYSYTINHYSVNDLQTPIDGTETVTVTDVPYETLVYIADVCQDIPGYVIDNLDDAPVKITANGIEVKCKYQPLKTYYRYQVTGSAGGWFDTVTDDNNVVGAKPMSTDLTLKNDGYYVKEWYYVVGNGSKVKVPESWITTSADGLTMTLSPAETPVEWAGKTVYIYAEIIPATRRFKVVGDVATNKEQAFMFNIKGTFLNTNNETKNVDITFVIYGNDYVDIERLPHGEYTLTILDWSWRYDHPTVTYNSVTQTFTNGSLVLDLSDEGEVVFTFTNAPEDKWLSDDLAGYLHFEVQQSETPTN